MEEDFINLAIQHGKEMQKGSENANKTHAALMKLKPALIQSNREFLEESCQHEDPSTRIWSATFIVSFNKNLALSTLSNVEKSENGVFKSNAKAVLHLINKGLL